ncbi:MAG: flavodoxin family protein [Deltaproteobacteria bacterium]|nr:flavodoxin family protein [Deltaproteobacteria bacterium]MBW1984869.1 flavodoxin family protein [Deltaproteobacteria bacterium]
MEIKDVKVKILGIAGTPIKNGNCQYQLEEALKQSEATGQATTELVHLRDYKLTFCIGCEKCMRKIHKIQAEVGFDVTPVPIEGYNCSIKDGLDELHQKMIEADAIILMAPVYIASIPGQVKTFIDRCRTFVHDFRLQDKVAAAMTIGFFRNAGQDTALELMRTSLSALGLNVVSFGSAAVSTREGVGVPIRETRFAVKEDLAGKMMMDIAVKKLVRIAVHIKAGKLALKEISPGLNSN